MKKRILALILSLTMIMSGNVAAAADNGDQSADTLSVLMSDNTEPEDEPSVEDTSTAADSATIEDPEGGDGEGGGSGEGEGGSDSASEGSEGGSEGGSGSGEGGSGEGGSGEGGSGDGSGSQGGTGEQGGGGASQGGTVSPSDEATKDKTDSPTDEASKELSEDESADAASSASKDKAAEEASEAASEASSEDAADEASSEVSFDVEIPTDPNNPDDDPEFYRYVGMPEEDPIPLRMASDQKLFGLGMGNEDPHVFKLNTGYKYSYPKYYKTDDDEKRVSIRYGMDISKYQKAVTQKSFETMKNEYDIEFVFLRAGFRGYGSKGTLNRDEYFVSNIRNAAAAGMRVGVYYFSQAISDAEAEAEADYCVQLIKESGVTPDMPVIMDYEYAGNPGRLKAANMSPAAKTSAANAFCNRVRKAGYTAGVYGSRDFILKDMNQSGIDSKNYIWMANYVSKDSNGVCSTSYTGRLEAWQFTSAFTGFGTNGLNFFGNETVDLNFWFGYFPGELCKLEYQANGGTGEMDSIEGAVDTSVDIAGCSFTRPGCHFKAWNTEPDGSGEYYVPSDTPDGSNPYKYKKKYLFEEQHNYLYAIWESTVAFDTRGGSAVESVTLQTDSALEEPSTKPTKEDYDFVGWFKDSECTKP